MIDKIAFSLGPLQIHWYGVIMGTAALLGVYLATREAKRRGLNPDLVLDMVLWILPAAIVGARIYFVIFQWDYYSMHPAEIPAVWLGGLAIHGGLIGAFIAGYIFARKHKIPFLALADLIIPSVLLGQAIGRWGNFINQEAHGGPVARATLEGLHIPNWIIDNMNIAGVTYHPTFLYESLWNLVGFLILIGMRYWNPRRGEIVFTYFIWYSLGRFYIEGLRTDSLAFDGPNWLASLMNGIWSPMSLLFEPGAMSYGNVRIAQLISLVLVILGILLIVIRRAKGYANESYQDFPVIEYATDKTEKDQPKKSGKKKEKKKRK